MYGRHRQSIADIEETLTRIFIDHEHSYTNDHGFQVIPADYLFEVLDSFSLAQGGVELLNHDEAEQLRVFLDTNSELEVTPQVLVQFVAEKTKTRPDITDEEELFEPEGSFSPPMDPEELEFNGRTSRPPSRGGYQPPTPSSALSSSTSSTALDKRLKNIPSTPRGPESTAPSSFSRRPVAPHRRKSIDNGSRSDGESWSASPSSYGTGRGGRARAPSTPGSPTGAFSGPGSRPPSRPSSRTGGYSRYGSSSQNDLSYPYSPPSPRSGYEDDSDLTQMNIHQSIASLQMQSRSPHSSPNDSSESSDDEEDGMDSSLIPDRQVTSSTVSMLEPHDRLDALQRTNTDLNRRLMEAERTLQKRLIEHDTEIEDMQSRIDELSAELGAAKREEKELRAKERASLSQIALLESELAKLSKTLDSSKATYASLQKQYQEQVSISEKYRSDLRHRDLTIQSLKENASVHAVEQDKWLAIERNYEERIAKMEQELMKADDVVRELDEQKRENWMLKETIDRMKYDMDELRQNLASGINTTVGGGNQTPGASRDNTVSKSLGAELAAKMKWPMTGEEPAPQDDDEQSEGAGEEDEEIEEITEKVLSGDDTEGEDVIQTIITRKKKKVPSRAHDPTAGTTATRARPTSLARHFEESKDYSDSGTQHDHRLFMSSVQVQTDPVPALIKIQEKIIRITEEIPVPVFPEPKQTGEIAVQATPPPSPTIKVEEPEPEPQAGPSRPQNLLRTKNTPFDPLSQQLALGVDGEWEDLPPAYEEEKGNLREETFALRKWHRSLHGHSSVLIADGKSGSAEVILQSLDGLVVTPETQEQWDNVKKAVGLDCTVMDKVIASAIAAQESSPSSPKKKENMLSAVLKYLPKSIVRDLIVPSSISIVVFYLLLNSGMLVAHYSVPGGPTYGDRLAWREWNMLGEGGEGFALIPGGYDYRAAQGDEADKVWSFIGRVGWGAMGVIRGWPV